MHLFNLVLGLSLVASEVFGANLQESAKARRAGTVGLFPFPRVGRSQPERTWMLPPQDYAELHRELKRQGLIPFPRVGRAMLQQSSGKRSNGDTNGGGMWFGPRLGRIAKKSGNQYEEEDPWNMLQFRELIPPRDFTPRLGREEEELADDQVEQIEQPEQEIH